MPPTYSHSGKRPTKKLKRIIEGISRLLDVNLGIREGERILVLAEVPSQEDWDRLPSGFLQETLERARLARRIKDVAALIYPRSPVRFLCYSLKGHNGEEPDERVSGLMAECDVVIAPTTRSLTHTKARQRATDNGARFASMPGLVNEMLLPGGPLDIDYGKVREETQLLASTLSRGHGATVTCSKGTNLRLSIHGRIARESMGLIRNRGEWGNIPSGEASIAPKEGSVEGKLIVQAGWFPKLGRRMVMFFDGGQLVELSGGAECGDDVRQQVLGPGVDRSRCVVAELGVGTNPNAKRRDIVLEAEKIRGTVHVAIGNNIYLGGANLSDIHLDFVVPEATLVIDAEIVLEKGVLRAGS